jgi:hypothetical protein
VAATGKRLGAGAAAEIAELAAERDDAEGADRRIEVILVSTILTFTMP